MNVRLPSVCCMKDVGFLHYCMKYFSVSHQTIGTKGLLSFSKTTFQAFPGISDLLSEVPKCQHCAPNVAFQYFIPLV